MATPTTNALALHEILLSISDSLNKAQNELRNMPPFDEFGRPNTIYQLPYLDFNLEVISEFAGGPSSSSSPPRSTQLAQVPTGNYLKFVPFAATDYSKLSTNKITSVISGRFVAVLPNEGLPQVYVYCQAVRMADTTTPPTVAKYRITVRLQNATGTLLDGQRVEVNFDQQNSYNINGDDPQTMPVFTSPKDGFTGTNGNSTGEFVTDVELDLTDYDAGLSFIFVANSGNLFSSIAISNS